MAQALDCIVIGAGLAGLCCGLKLQEAGLSIAILDADDQVGGRVRTDAVDGFLLDRGFQVLLTAYPETQRLLDYRALSLGEFQPGALIRYRNRFEHFSDPWRAPLHALETLFSPVGTIADKLRVARLRQQVLAGSLEHLFSLPETTTLQALHQQGFSQAMIDAFWKPFLGGIFLEAELETSSRMFAFVFRMFSQGLAVLPAEGMQAIPRQLAARLPQECLRLNTRVNRLTETTVALADGEILNAKAVILATDGPEAAQLLPALPTQTWHAVTCLYFAAPHSPVYQPILLLNGNSRGLVNNVCVPSNVSPTYAPSGQALISVSILGNSEISDAELAQAVQVELIGWFGFDVEQWQLLRVYRIAHALPVNSGSTAHLGPKPAQVDGIFVCGDYRDTPSIQGAMVSGRRTAEAVLKRFGM